LWLPEGYPRRKQVEAVALCRKALLAWERYTNTQLNPQDFEEAHAELVKIAWARSRRYNPHRGVSIDQYLYGVLVRRANDFLRSKLGRTKWQWKSHTYEKPPELAPLSLDAGSGGDSRSLGELLAAPDRSVHRDWDEAHRWAVAERNTGRAARLRRIDDEVLAVDEKGIQDAA